MRLLHNTLFLALLAAVSSSARAGDGNRLAYLDGNDLYCPSRKFPKLTTPMWVGEEGVEAVVVLAIDDMRGHQKWETYLRPILQRLRRIDGRSPVSIMTCQIDPKEPHLQRWLKEGLSLEVHTVDHPCPILKDGNFERARSTYDRCVDMLASVPHSKPVAFRTPCCDSLNTPSPRLFAEIFNKSTAKGNFLTIDSSVFNVTTPDDPDLPRDLVLEKDGTSRFAKYLPKDRTFVNTIEDYPYPYVIGRLCWEFPCATPSDWLAQHHHGPNNPATVRDWKALLDATVIKQGVFCLVFHPHGWIGNEQIVDLIDHADRKYGKKVKFLNFRECQERLNKNLLGGQPLRDPKTGWDNGVRLLDVNNDGFMDVVIGNDKVQQTRVWSPKTKSWVTSGFPAVVVSEPGPTPARGPTRARIERGTGFGILQSDGQASLLQPTLFLFGEYGGSHFDRTRWGELQDHLLDGLRTNPGAKWPAFYTMDDSRLRDLNRDGMCELIVSREKGRYPAEQVIFAWSAKEKRWIQLPFTLPPGVYLFNADGKDNGVRFVDLNEDGFDDIVFSYEKEYGVYLFTDMKKGWSRRVMAGKRDDKDALPM
ncbi:MAG TPA: polysaccharide deacetylase family protein, partial [Gemmataceae bacterium]|nr:polysaccharide deacetylase family protein [Gemmataceae bacterium]